MIYVVRVIGLFVLVLSLTLQYAYSNETKYSASAAIQLIDKDLDEAERIIVEILKDFPNDAEANFYCGRIMGRQAEEAFFSAFAYAQKSLFCLKQAVALSPNEYRYRLGLLNFYLGAPSIAGGDEELAWQQVVAISELNTLQGAKAEVKYLQSTNQQNKLKTRLVSMRKSFPADAEIHFHFGLIMQEENNYQEAYDAFKAAADTRDNSHYYLNALYQLGRNAVFSEINIQQGVDGLLLFINEAESSKNIPPIEWAYLRLAQLYSAMQNESLKQHYSALAYKSDDRDLHRALKTLQKVSQ